MESRNTEIAYIWKQNQWLYGFIGFMVGIVFFPLLDAVSDFGEVFMSLIPELIGIVITVLFIDRLYRNRELARDTNQLKQQLIHEMASSINAISRNAVERLRRLSWLLDGTLKNADLFNANLSHAELHFADLAGVDLQSANLREANLAASNLRNTILREADLRGAILHHADLTGADLADVQFDNDTRLPDTTYWKETTDMKKYTDTNHPEFWRSWEENSPAFGG